MMKRMVWVTLVFGMLVGTASAIFNPSPAEAGMPACRNFESC